MTLAPDLPFSLARRSPLFNMGGPRSRTRTESVKSSLLGKTSGAVKCPRTRILGFIVEQSCDPVAAAYEALERLGCNSPEELRQRFKLPPSPCLVIPVPGTPKRRLADLSDQEFLAEALLLGLCTKTMYDPGRPVVWTQASLTRRLQMFRTGGFYALD